MKANPSNKIKKKDFIMHVMLDAIAVFVALVVIGFFSLMFQHSRIFLTQTILFNATIHIRPATNVTYCTTLNNCTNYTQAGNFTKNFSINNIGYLKISTLSNESILLISYQHFSGLNASNYVAYAKIFKEFLPTTFITAVLNYSTSPVLIVVAPGNETLIAYNYNNNSISTNIDVRYFYYNGT